MQTLLPETDVPGEECVIDPKWIEKVPLEHRARMRRRGTALVALGFDAVALFISDTATIGLENRTR